MKQFYVWYDQDAGQVMTCHALIQSPSWEYAHQNWVRLVRERGKACNPVWDRYEGLVEVPDDATLEWCDQRYGTNDPSLLNKITSRLFDEKDPYRGQKRTGSNTVHEGKDLGDRTFWGSFSRALDALFQ